ncbi:MAG TPA: hypothetical protein VHK64_00300, partial [Nocardioidaceae bacterium]|nr:hypothetical protein [Nocardioidaceae bacterium]
QSIWDGHLDAYLKPLPLTTDGKPNRARACPAFGSTQPRSSCHLWDAGEVLTTQAADLDALASASVIDESALRLGTATNERRVFYGKGGVTGILPRTLRLLSPPTGDVNTDPDWVDIWNGFKVGFTDRNAAKTRTRDIIVQTLGVKASSIDSPSGGTIPIRYLLGDIFHSDPLIVDRPNDFGFFSSNLKSKGQPCAASGGDPGYQCYAERQSRRRKMLIVGSNDGQLHVFDAGVWDPSRKMFNDGSGKELFALVPRPQMPVLRDLAEGSKQIFGMDATPRIDDVFLDPRHNGTPDPDQREWRTILVGGYREGGSKDGGGRMTDFVSGYYAVDITQPDQLDTSNVPIDTRVVPSCLSTTNATVTGCGTLPFPALLWEFQDALGTSQLDEDDTNGDGIADGNGYVDLGQSWSVPTIGRIQVIEAGKTVDKFVAIFGGGMDADSKSTPRRGNWLYMVDIETGKAIYKRQLVGATPADVAALDIDLDGFLDTVYIGTTAGLMYKVDLRTIPT